MPVREKPDTENGGAAIGSNEFERLHTPGGLAYSQLVLEVLRANARLVPAGDSLAREFGLSAARWLVMGAIHNGRKSMSEIARDRGLTRQSVQEIVTEMKRQKLVTLAEKPEDRRAKLVELSTEGVTLFRALTERWSQRANRLAQSFDKGELAAALDVVRRLSLDFE